MANVVRPRRPASLTFLAGCQLVAGIVGLVYEIFMAGMALIFLFSPSTIKAIGANNPSMEGLTEVPIYFETLLTASLVGLVLSIVLIADGIGLFKVRRWAYNLGVLYGWLSIAYQVAFLAYLIVVAMPVKMAGYENVPVSAGTTMQPDAYRSLLKSGEISGDAGLAIGLTYPIFVLIMLGVTRKAFRRPVPLPERENLPDPETGRTIPADEGPPLDYGGEPDDRIGTSP